MQPSHPYRILLMAHRRTLRGTRTPKKVEFERLQAAVAAVTEGG
jgi:hypothetical protein